MTDLELFKAITRAVTNVPHTKIADAVATVRALFIQAEPPKPVERADRAGRNRMATAGFDRKD